LRRGAAGGFAAAGSSATFAVAGVPNDGGGSGAGGGALGVGGGEGGRVFIARIGMFAIMAIAES
jgi:hypothetical protein